MKRRAKVIAGGVTLVGLAVAVFFFFDLATSGQPIFFGLVLTEIVGLISSLLGIREALAEDVQRDQVKAIHDATVPTTIDDLKKQHAETWREREPRR